ncbi:MAG: hypothetical protein JWL77_3206 [Chthonomonadaceae bacterium]|nr:hypothetical protein [Chthonomonadaceae bacterium]
MKNRLPIVYLYPGSTFKSDVSRQTKITEALAEHTTVVFVQVAEYTHNFAKVPAPTIRQAGKNILVVENALGYLKNRLGKRLGPVHGMLDGRNLHNLLRTHGIDEYVYWLSVPIPELLEGMRTDRLVYDCIDPCMIASEQANYDAAEARVAARSKVVFCTAEILLERMQKLHNKTFLLNNGSAPEDFAAESAADLPLPKPLQGRPRPIVGYMGTIDWRVDVETILEAARALPDYTFCIAGRVNHDQEHRVTELRTLPNVVMPGSVSIEEGPAYNAAFDVGLIPYLPGDIGDSINPVKMYMYLTMGKPVVTTWVRECRNNRPLVSATRTPEEFAEAIRQAVSEQGDAQRSARIAFAHTNTWQVRAETAIQYLEEAGLFS